MGCRAIVAATPCRHAERVEAWQHKELRFAADGGVWRVAFAFDPQRRAIVLVAGGKAGVSQGRFYRSLIRTADVRFDEHLEHMERRR